MAHVSPQVRDAEAAIDGAIRALPVWQSTRDATLKAVLDVYRDLLDVVFVEMGRQRILAEFLGPREATPLVPIVMEHRLHTGIFWILKWALAWCPDAGHAPPTPDDITSLVGTGSAYVHLVDALWMHKRDWGRVDVDLASRTLLISEGGDQTGGDRELAEYLHGFLALHRHHSFTDDSDKLTSRWTAGEYRAFGKALIDECSRLCTETVQFSGTDPPLDLFKRPVILPVPDALVAQHEFLVRDLALTHERLADPGACWRLSSWLDTPLVECGGAYWCASNAVQSVFREYHDDYMLRLAALVDAKHYSLVSQAREQRMRDFCVKALESKGWTCTAPLTLKNPQADIDVYAVRGSVTLLLELKSTLRPETPREVASRNDDIHLGIRKSEERRARFPEDTIAVVVTDGYRGEYRTWADALRRRVPLLTTDELDRLATDPTAYLNDLRVWSETRPIGDNPFPERESVLLDWRLVVRDCQ